MGTMSVARGGLAGNERATKRQEAACAGQRSRLRRVAQAAVRISQRALESWCGSEGELGASGALTDEHVSAIASLALSGDPPFAQ